MSLNATLAGRRSRYQSRLMMAMASLTLVACASMTTAQAAQGTTARAVAAWPKWGHAQSLPFDHAQPDPAHWLQTIGPHVAGGTEATAESTNWSGYVDTGAQFTGVSGEWVVPQVQSANTLAASATWIGIDGATNTSLIQTGTTQEITGGVPTYFAWYEILPNYAVPIGEVVPGDQMQAFIFEDSPGVWTININDLTEQQSAAGEVAYNGPGASAEWIEEDPQLDGAQPPLANFGTEQFSDLSINGSGLGSAVATPVDMVNDASQVIAYPGSLANDAFTITYGAPPPPAPVITTTSLPSASLNVPYSQTLGASGGTSPYTWSIASGALPMGLSLTPSTGAISGTPTVAGTQDLTFKVTDANDQSASVPLSITVVVPAPYSPLTPVRICDTRAGNPSSLSGDAAQCNGTANAGSTIAAGGTKTIDVAGDFGVPADATAVVLNVTVVSPAASGFLTAFPTAATQPFTANVNYTAGQVVPNLVEVGTGTSGEVSIYSKAKADIVVDLEGYVDATASGGTGAGLYDPLASPARLCDTRAGNPSDLSGGDAQCNGTAGAGERLAAGGTIPVQVTGNNTIPAGATAAVLNVTVVNPSASGYLTVFPQGAAQPFTANVNYNAAQTTGNRVIVPLSTTGGTPGAVSIYSKSAADVVVDVSGYYSAAGGSGSQFNPESPPVRICDTRAGNPSGLSGGANQCDNETLAAAATDLVNVTGLAGIPTGATAVVVNLTAVTPTQGTFLTVFPGPTRPFVSDLNPAAGAVAGNLTVATLSSNGQISIYNNTGSVDVVVDVLGWYTLPPA